MIKKLLLTLILTSLISIAYCQSPINSFYGADNSVFDLLNSSTPLEQSAFGANLIWNFNELSSIGSTIQTYTKPTTPEITTYPGTTDIINSTINIDNTSSTGSIYTKNQAGEVSITGLNASSLEVNFITNNATIGTFPMNYEYSNNDNNAAGNYTYSTYSGTFSGTMNTTVDAYGTLSLNDTGFGSYSGNVTRLKSVLNISLNYSIFSNAGTATQTTYSYYDSNEGSGNPIFRSTTTTIKIPLLSINQTETSLERFNTILLNVNNSLFTSLWIKNPVESNIEIYNSSNIDNINIVITDLSGKIIFQTKNITLNGSLEIPVSLTKGIYLLTIENESGTITKKIVKY